MLQIVNHILERKMWYDNIIVLTYHIEYPTIKVLQDNYKGIKKFNSYNYELAMLLKEKSENELYQEAIELYQYNKDHGYPQMTYEVYQNYRVTFNRSNIVSLYVDEYLFTGRGTWKYNTNLANLGFKAWKNNAISRFLSQQSILFIKYFEIN